MRIAASLLRKIERWLGAYEGPEPPVRLEHELRVWAAAHPEVTIPELLEYAAHLQGLAYREGFQRGYWWHIQGIELGGDDEAAKKDAEQNSVSLVDLNERARRMVDDVVDPEDPFAGVAMPARRGFFEALDRTTATVRWDDGE